MNLFISHLLFELKGKKIIKMIKAITRETTIKGIGATEVNMMIAIK
jgi:hypothetical protein